MLREEGTGGDRRRGREERSDEGIGGREERGGEGRRGRLMECVVMKKGKGMFVEIHNKVLKGDGMKCG